MSTVVATARRAVRFELGMWRSIFRWLARRPHIPAEHAAFAYRGPTVAPIVVFLGVSLIEVVAVDLLVPWPWEWLRLVLLALGIWGTAFMLGMIAALTVCPHVVGPAGLWVRYGTSLDVHLPWDAIAGARQVRRTRDGRKIQLDGEMLHVVVASQTTVEITLNRPVVVTLPRDRTAEITAVRLYADDGAAMVTAIRAHTPGV